MSQTTVYVHVPFCVVKCGYCDFNSYTAAGEEPLDRFLSGLEAELRMVEIPRTPPSIFIGGGTPTYLDAARFERLFEVLDRHLDMHACAEVTVEANPESVTLEKAQIARAAGVNRVSIGAQSFNARHLAFLDRAHSADETRSAVEVFRTAGFENLSLDLIFGVPDQSLAEWEQDLEQVLLLQPDHLSCYNLAYEPGTRLTRDLDQGKVTPNEEDVDRQMFLRTREILAAEGFEAYEISNFAGRGGICHHNDHYWLQGDYLGLGPGAAEHRQGLRTTNLKALVAWSDRIASGERPIGSQEQLNLEERAGEALWLGLRRQTGVDTAALSQHLNMDVVARFRTEIEDLAGRGLLTQSATSLCLTEQGVLFANTVGEMFLVT